MEKGNKKEALTKFNVKAFSLIAGFSEERIVIY